MEIHSNILAWRIPWTEQPGGPQFMGLQRVGHDWSDLAHKQISVYVLRIRIFSCVTRRRQWHPTPVLLPGKSHGRRSLVACSPSDTTEQIHFHFSLSCVGEGNGNPLQCSCLENPRDAGAWWAAVCGVAQSRTRLKWLSSSSLCNHNTTLTLRKFNVDMVLLSNIQATFKYPGLSQEYPS